MKLKCEVLKRVYAMSTEKNTIFYNSENRKGFVVVEPLILTGGEILTYIDETKTLTDEQCESLITELPKGAKLSQAIEAIKGLIVKAESYYK